MPFFHQIVQCLIFFTFSKNLFDKQVMSSGYICEFHDLQIKAVLLDEVMRSPDNPEKEHIINFETKSLRDTRNLLNEVSIQVSLTANHKHYTDILNCLL